MSLSPRAERLLREANPQPDKPPLFAHGCTVPLWCKACRAAGRKIYRLELAACGDGCNHGAGCRSVLACPVCDTA